MPYVVNHPVKIHFQQIGEGPPLVLQHGFSDSISGWYEAGWVKRLGRHFRLIMIDARGHGFSDKPHSPTAYELAHRVADILTVIDTLGLERVHYLGYSMGGWIGLGLADAAPHRLLSMALGGIHPYGQDMSHYRIGVAGGMSRWARLVQQAAGGHMTDSGIRRIQANDPQALAAAVAYDRPALAGIASKLHCPCLMFVGENDPLLPQVERFSSELPEARLVRIDNADHVQTFYAAKRLAPAILAHIKRSEMPASV
ncbi:alpha/beta hydrolase [Halomonas sp. M5N1S17]|uniref:alpha/beta fold hydrolase n=1 Tax=Halomonas alkalisoli TaxID=2907158 RepID=UPI001F33F253|nr:alpha/beta hydrolase [Halomonas alkalisoli]MCE9665586.1 alpha/beta hydrolase [Halomonas alkalisoli]